MAYRHKNNILGGLATQNASRLVDAHDAPKTIQNGPTRSQDALWTHQDVATRQDHSRADGGFETEELCGCVPVVGAANREAPGRGR